jgi:acetylornithine/LysW-gamma-L-lysine aminotransferase
MSVSSSKEMRDPFKPLVPGVTHVGFNDFEALAGAIDNQTAAVILELVQGEGGVHPADPGFVSHARKLCDHHGALLVVDEVQTGFGRTGKLFALEHHAIRADIVCVAKGMAGGFPMGAVLVNESIQVGVGLHGSTFGGHPVACAAAAATLQVLLSGTILESVSAKGDRIVDALSTANLPIVREIRHLGLMIGIETRVRARPILIDLAERGVLALPAGSRVVRLLPPLTISNDEIDRVVDAVVSGRRQ